MRIDNVHYLTEDLTEEFGSFTAGPDDGSVINGEGGYILPSFVDTHIHGAFGYDTSDGIAEDLVKMAKKLPGAGVAAFLPTTMTISEDDIMRSLQAVCDACEMLADEPDAARILGVHLEGPFLSPLHSGVQDGSCLVTPEDGIGLMERIDSRFPGLVRIVDIAPELPGSAGFIRRFSKDHVISLAHSSADAACASEAFRNGAVSVTHMLNAMEPCLKRSPGIPGAAYERDDVFCEIICDGIHIDRTVLKMIFRLYGDRLIVISDSMRGAGMGEGRYMLGNTEVEVRNGRTYYGENGGLAGSVTDMASEACVLFNTGISLRDIVLSTSYTPLKRIGCSLTGRYNLMDRDMKLICML